MACSLTSPSTRGPRAREGQLGCCPPRARVDGLEPPSSFSLRRATGRPPFWERPSRALPGLRRRSPQGWAVGPSRRKVVNAAARLPHRNPRAARYFVCCCRRRSIACAICSCSSAIFVKPFARRRAARARCHFGDSSRDFSRSSSVDIGCPLEEAAARGTCRAGDLLGAHSRASAPMRTPPRAWDSGADWAGFRNPSGGPWGWGV